MKQKIIKIKMMRMKIKIMTHIHNKIQKIYKILNLKKLLILQVAKAKNK